jgi:hypothetical protein
MACSAINLTGAVLSRLQRGVVLNTPALVAPEITWSKVQATSATIVRTQAYGCVNSTHVP